MNSRDPQRETPEEILAITLIVNGPLGMSAGKIAAQALQAHYRLSKAYQEGAGDSRQRLAYERWQNQGTRTITRIAETPAIFERACRELPGVTMIDEGLTEVAPDSPTIHITWPLPRQPAPRMLTHKRAPLLSGPPITNRYGGPEPHRTEPDLRQVAVSV